MHLRKPIKEVFGNKIDVIW